MGDHSNYVHFAEPGKVNYYGAILLAVPIEEVIAKTPYHQAEAQYKKGGRPINTQEKFGAITVHPAQLPLAASMRLAELNDRFASGLLDETTQGGTNNISFAASTDRKFAGEYGYAFDKLKVICNPDNALRVQDFVPAGQLIVANEQGMDFGRSVGTAGFQFEKPIDMSQETVTVYGPLSQRRVDFSEDHLRIEAAQKTFISQEQQRKNEVEEKYLKAWADKVRSEADATGMSVEEYEAWRDEEYRKKIDEMFAGGKPIEIPSFGASVNF